jgi:hypothetical protein
MGGIPDVLGFGRTSTGALRTACLPHINSRHPILASAKHDRDGFHEPDDFPFVSSSDEDNYVLGIRITPCIANEHPLVPIAIGVLCTLPLVGA